MSKQEATVPRKCLACDAKLTSPIVCQGCHKLYPMPTSVDYFELLGLERSYNIDPKLLGERFVSVSRHVHPDFFTGAGHEMSQLSTRLSAELNEAVKVLKDPVLRAGYLLEISGGPSASDDRTVPPAVLAEAMLLREEIEQSTTDKNKQKLQELQESVEEKQNTVLAEIAELAGKLPGADDEDKSRLRHALNSMRYYRNIQDMLWNACES